MRVLKYYVENKALFETWKQGKRNWSTHVLSHCEALRCETIKKKQKKLFSFMSNLPTFYHFKLDFPKVDQHTGGKWLIHGTKCCKDNQLQSLTMNSQKSAMECICESSGGKCLFYMLICIFRLSRFHNDFLFVFRYRAWSCCYGGFLCYIWPQEQTCGVCRDDLPKP